MIKVGLSESEIIRRLNPEDPSATSAPEDPSPSDELGETLRELSEAHCISDGTLSDEEARAQYDKYLAYATSRKKAIIRTLRNEVIENANLLNSADGLNLDLGMFGDLHLTDDSYTIGGIVGGISDIAGLFNGPRKALAAQPNELLISYSALELSLIHI